MTEPTDTRDGLHELLADVLMAETLDTDLLLRYARDAEALEAGERERVEAYLAASPAHRDRLRVLARFASSQRQNVAGEGVVVPISSHPRWRVRAAGVGVALAASLALAWLFGIPDTGPGPGAPPVVVAEERVGSGQEIAPTLPKDEVLAEAPEAPRAPSATQIVDTADPGIVPAPESPLTEQADEPTASEGSGVRVAVSPSPIEETIPQARVAPEREA
ncbi:MAG: hypothetical protein JRG89_06370, partial [Deltaproteobacteria bacterium]|nr:hypothetical protein [Deltaproteobacteria bacterium]